MSTHKRGRKLRFLAVLPLLALSACGLFNNDPFVRSDPPITGYKGSAQYSVVSTPDGSGEINEITFRGANEQSPFPMTRTVFGKAAGSRTQDVTITTGDGTLVNALAMNKWGMNVGLTNYLDAQVATYDQRDAFGNRVCGAKVRLNFKPLLVQQFINDKYRRAWDALWYYSIPCSDPATTTKPGDATKPANTLDLSRAKFMAMVIDQQFAPRVTGKPIFFNRGHSVTVVGGRASNFIGRWWQTPMGLMNASNLVIDMVRDLDEHEWLDFGNRDFGSLVYSAGDADVYLSLNRIFLNRQSSYLINFRSTPTEPWKRVLVNPVYNFEWNDLEQNYYALKGEKMPDIDEMVDQKTGLPKDLNDPDKESSKKLKEIETAGCQNCPNPTLEQIQFIDVTSNPDNGSPMYAMTIRGWMGANSSLVMFGNVPQPRSSYQDEAEKRRQASGAVNCPIFYDEVGNRKPDKEQISQEQCATLLREGALWDMLTKDASRFGFDVVGQFRVRDNSTWASECSGSGDSTVCVTKPIERKLDAAYMFTDTGDKLQKAWTVMQLLGEVGMRTLGMSYASGQYDGSGLNFAMAQPQVYNSYFAPPEQGDTAYEQELLFALDARALQLPNTLRRAAENLGMR